MTPAYANRASRSWTQARAHQIAIIAALEAAKNSRMLRYTSFVSNTVLCNSAGARRVRVKSWSDGLLENQHRDTSIPDLPTCLAYTDRF